MAYVERKIGGYDFADWLAHEPMVRPTIQLQTAKIGHTARRLKKQWVDEGHSYIEWDMGEVDGRVILNDMRGKQAAMAMEYGSAPRESHPDGTPVQEILHKAAGIPMKQTNPRSRRKKKLTAAKRRRNKRSRDRRRRAR